MQYNGYNIFQKKQEKKAAANCTFFLGQEI